MDKDLDEDVPFSKPSPGARSKLSSLFADSVSEDVSFHYSQPKPPPVKSTAQQSQSSFSVIMGKTVDAFRLLKSSGFCSEGKLGIAILGNEEDRVYKLYMYRSTEKKVASVDVTPDFAVKVQENNYISFKDSCGVSWSLHFDQTDSLVAFARELAFVRWKSGKDEKTVSQDAFIGDIQSRISDKDTIEVNFNVFEILKSKIRNEIGTLRKEDLASSSFWLTNFTGKCLNSKTFVVVKGFLLAPFGLSVNPKQVFLVEMDVTNIKHAIKETVTVQSSDKDVSDQSSCCEFTPYKPEAGQAQKSPRSSPKRYNLIKEEQRIGSPSEISFDLSSTPQMNVFLSEVRTSNSEIRMNINRVSDKVDSLMGKVNSCEEINSKLKPFMDKVASLENHVSALFNQNHSTLKRFEEGTEIESLIRKNSILEGNLNDTNSLIKKLEAKVQLLQDSLGESKSCDEACRRRFEEIENRTKVLQTEKKDLEKQNAILSKHATALLTEKSEKESDLISSLKSKENSIFQLKKSLELASTQIKHYRDKENMEKDLKCSVQRVLNWADMALKAQFKDPPKGESCEEIISSTLREVGNEFFRRTYNAALMNRAKASLSSSEHSPRQTQSITEGSFFASSFSPSSPLPKPRKPCKTDSEETKASDEADNTIPFDEAAWNDTELNDKVPNQTLPVTVEDKNVPELKPQTHPKPTELSNSWREQPPPVFLNSDDEKEDAYNSY